jgi:TolB-like protein
VLATLAAILLAQGMIEVMPPAAETPAVEPAPSAPPEPAPAAAPPAETPAPATDLSVAVLQFAGEGDERRLAGNLTGLVLARLAERPGVRAVGQEEVEAIIGFERAKQLIGCEADHCAAEIGGALGVRYLLHGAVGRVGATFLVRLALIELARATAVHRVVSKVEDEGALIAAVETGADELFDKAAFPARAPKAAAPAPAAPRNWHVAIKPGPGFIATLLALGVTLHVEVGYYLRPELMLFFQPGISVTASDINQYTAAVVPVMAGARYLFLHDSNIRPYVALGLGLNFIAQMVGGQGSAGGGLSFTGMGGVEWLPWPQVGFLLEASLDLVSGVQVAGGGLAFSPTIRPGVFFRF